MSIVQKIIVFRLHDFLKTVIFSVGLSFNIAALTTIFWKKCVTKTELKKVTMIPYSAASDSKIIFFIGTSKQSNDFDLFGLHISNSGYWRPTNPEFELKNPPKLEKDPLQCRVL